MIRQPPGSTLFPDPTLFRSGPAALATRLEVPRARAEQDRPQARTRRHAAAARRAADRGHRPGADRARSGDVAQPPDRKSTRLNSSHANISYAVFCFKKKKEI